MKFALPIVAASLVVLAGCGEKKKESATETAQTKYVIPNAKAPVAKQVPKELTMHGDVRQDEYYWLKEREDQEVVSYLKAENAFVDTTLSPIKQLREDLFAEMKGHIKEEDESVPTRENGYYYFQRFGKGQEYATHLRKKGSLESAEEVTFDENVMAKGKPYFDMSGYEVSDDGRYAAYGIDTVSRRLYVMKIRDLQTGKDLSEKIENTDGGNYVWSTDGQHLFYIKKNPETLLGYAVMRHKVGTPASQDVQVWEEKDNQFYIGIARSKSGKYISLYSGQNGVMTEMYFLDAAKPEGQFVSFLPRRKGHEYTIEDAGDKFYIHTNKDGATNFKLMEAPAAAPGNEANWKEVVAHDPNALLEGMEATNTHLAYEMRKEGMTRLMVMDRKTGKATEIPFRDPAFNSGLTGNAELDQPYIRYHYASLTTPNSIYDYELATGKSTLRKEQEVPGGFDKENYTSERRMAKAADGTEVPVSIVYKKGTKIDGTAPCLLYSYGSYGSSTDPGFSATRLVLLDRGFVFAMAHIRGGSEMGRKWYEDGKLLKKMNTFTDFNSVAEFMIENKYSAKDKLFAFGGSAGGLLMGAVANLRPDLYKGIVAAVPFVDVVTTMLDTSIPLTTNEYEEWGNPNKKEYYDYMKTYSPYDNVKAQAYPNMLVTTGLHDSQVQYWEPAKWVARLRRLKTDDNLLLLHTDMEAGHGGASGRFEYLKEYALMYGFMVMLSGDVEMPHKDKVLK